jgi:hypothetical protein
MWIEVRGQNGQDDGNKHNKGDVGHENGLETVNRHNLCQPQVSFIKKWERQSGASSSIESFLIQ